MAWRHFDRYAFPSGEAMYKGLEIDPNKNLIIVDSDCIVYPTAFGKAAKESCEAALLEARRKFDDLIIRSIASAGTSATVVQFFTMSGSPKYRDQFINKVPYKENRKKTTVQPLWVNEIQNELITLSNSVFCNPILGEADDFISILAHHHMQYKSSLLCPLVVGADKDLDTIHCNRVDNKGYRMNTKFASKMAFYKQVLMGDSADNVKGLSGIGARKANGILNGAPNEEEMYNRTLKAYLEAFNYDEDEACAYLYETASLLYLRKDFDDYWNPPV